MPPLLHRIGSLLAYIAALFWLVLVHFERFVAQMRAQETLNLQVEARIPHSKSFNFQGLFSPLLFLNEFIELFFIVFLLVIAKHRLGIENMILLN